MPIGFLTAADRARLNRFPEQIPHEDLSAFFLLSEADQTAINQQHSEAHTRLGFALQLCALRYLGFAPDDLRRRQRERSSMSRSNWAWRPKLSRRMARVGPRGPPTSNRCRCTCTFAWPPRWICMPCKRG